MSQVVNLTVEQHIAIVEMADRASNNTFSADLIRGLGEVFKKISEDPEIKVVVIHGYDNYFCCGGTKEELLKIFSGEMTFADLSFYRVLLDCPVPTIAAMQGHAIGGGLAFGCYADLMVLGEECLYTANFMKYGFTPGMGGTYIIPKKFGENIGAELLYTANNFQGLVLKNKGITLPVVKKAEVVNTALQLAQQFTDKPQSALKLLKAELTREIREILPTVIRRELEMHRITFANPDVKARIESLFGH